MAGRNNLIRRGVATVAACLLLPCTSALEIPVEAQESQWPVVHSSVECQSELLDGGKKAVITPDFTLHWKLKGEAPDEFEAVVEYFGAEGWVSLGFSEDGKRVHDKAIIGSDTGVQLYDLAQTSTEGLVPIKDEDVTKGDKVANVRGEISQRQGKTDLVFTMNVVPFMKPQDGLYKLLLAGGDDNKVGYHRHRAAFRINLNSCIDTAPHASGSSGGATTTTTPTKVYDHRAAFAAHGFFATLTFAVIIPFAVSAAWFRSLMPKWWIYVHVLCNCLAFFFSTLAVAIAFGGMVMRGKSGENESHMAHYHHWIGLVLFLFVFFQVFNGFRRPPVEAKAEAGSGEMGGGGGNGSSSARTARETWHIIHRLTAILLLILMLVQMQTGLTLFADEYQGGSRSTIIVFWVWMSLLLVFMLGMKLYVAGRDRRTARMRASMNIMPQRAEDDESMGSGSYASSQAGGSQQQPYPHQTGFSNVI